MLSRGVRIVGVALSSQGPPGSGRHISSRAEICISARVLPVSWVAEVSSVHPRFLIIERQWVRRHDRPLRAIL
jgi:hypothetical protein